MRNTADGGEWEKGDEGRERNQKERDESESFDFLSFRLNKQASTLEVAKRRCNKNRFVIGF